MVSPASQCCPFLLPSQCPKPHPHFCHQKEDSIIVGTSTGATYQLQLLPVRVGSLEKRWVRTKPFQHHTHDVRAVVHSGTALISGGRAGRGHRKGTGFPLVPVWLSSAWFQAWMRSW